MEKLKCPHCGSTHTRKKGMRDNGITQSKRYLCNSCGKSFCENIGEPKRMVIFSDLHAGHQWSITHPNYQVNENHPAHQFQKEAWDWLSTSLTGLGKVDIFIGNGDMIDGKARKNGGVELITTDMLTQVKMAESIINQVKATRCYFTVGTGYHTGNEEDFERVLADNCKGELHDVLRLSVNGVKFRFRHHVGSSVLPWTKSTAPMRNAFLDRLNNREADVHVFSHVHYYSHAGFDDTTVITTPALQYNSSYGKRRCEGHTDFGFVVFDIYPDGHYTFFNVLKRFDHTHETIEI